MKLFYVIGFASIGFSTGAMDKPAAVADALANKKLEKPMTQEERDAVKKQVKQYIRQYHPTIFQNLIDHIKGHKQEQTVIESVPELTPEQIAQRDKVTLAADGSIPLTMRECIDLGITDDPRIREMAERDPYTKMTRDMERAGATDSLIAEVMEARENQMKMLKEANVKSPYESFSHHYNTWMRRFEDNSKRHELDFDQWLSELTNKSASGHSVKDLTYDKNGDTITTRVFLYNNLPKDEAERAVAGNLDRARLSDMRTMLDDLKLDFNVPRKDGQLPLNVALAHGRYQAASQLILGTFGGQKMGDGPVNLKLTPEQQVKNPFLITLIDSLETSLEKYAYYKDSKGVSVVNHSVEEYLKTQYLVLAFYLLEKGATTEYPQGLPDPKDYAFKKGFDKFGHLISLARVGKLKPALELVGQDIAQTDKDLVNMGIEPYRLI
jgi:hypothetical protein